MKMTKKESVIVVVLCLAFVSSCWGNTAEAPAPAAEQEFNYFVFALVWPNQYCISYPNTCNPSKPRQYFTIHGLWPEYNSTSYPQYCETNEQLTDDNLVTLKNEYELLKYWPYLGNAQNFTASLDFWKHQWNRHGTCSASKFTALEYFQKAIDLGKAHSRNIKDALKKKKVKADGSKYLKLKIIEAVVNATGAVPHLSFAGSSGNEALMEIRMCVKDDAVTLFDCPEEFVTFAGPPSSSSPPSWRSYLEDVVDEAYELL